MNKFTSSNKKKTSLMSRDGRKCMICDCPLRLPGEPQKNHPPEFRAATVHHEIGISEGGSHAVDNLVLVCTPCHGEIHKEEVEKLIKAKGHLVRIVKEQHQFFLEERLDFYGEQIKGPVGDKFSDIPTGEWDE